MCSFIFFYSYKTFSDIAISLNDVINHGAQHHPILVKFVLVLFFPQTVISRFYKRSLGWGKAIKEQISRRQTIEIGVSFPFVQYSKGQWSRKNVLQDRSEKKVIISIEHMVTSNSTVKLWEIVDNLLVHLSHVSLVRKWVMS